MNLIQGTLVSRDEMLQTIENLEEALNKTLFTQNLSLESVVQAADKLSQLISMDVHVPMLIERGLTHSMAKKMVWEAKIFLTRDFLMAKVTRELGSDPFAFRGYGGYWEAYRPLGVLTHIAAGNAGGLPAISVIEGLLAGNINLLKLPSEDDGLSTLLLKMLVEIDPALAPYIYVFDLPSTDIKSIQALLQASDGAAVWGSAAAVSGIRRLAPAGLPLIEWGHRLSFAYFTKRGETPQALDALAQEIFSTDQLLCSSPQCVYYEADDWEDLKAFGQRLSLAMKRVTMPCTTPDLSTQAQITMNCALAQLEALLDEKMVISNSRFNIIVDKDPVLSPSPMYRNISVKPVDTTGLFQLLRSEKGYLQTVGLAALSEEAIGLQERFYQCGVSRVVNLNKMSAAYAGQPHDGQLSLQRYTKKVVSSFHSSLDFNWGQATTPD